eukprot:6176025-Prymnesium_polylepis.1
MGASVGSRRVGSRVGAGWVLGGARVGWSDPGWGAGWMVGSRVGRGLDGWIPGGAPRLRSAPPAAPSPRASCGARWPSRRRLAHSSRSPQSEPSRRRLPNMERGGGRRGRRQREGHSQRAGGADEGRLGGRRALGRQRRARTPRPMGS